MKRLISVSAAVAAVAAFTAAPASAAEGKAYGQQIKTTLGASYGQLFNSVRDNPPPGHQGVFPPADGAKAFYEIHRAGS
jgi:hypothetical protein